MINLWSYLLSILALGVIIFVHELGHFLLAKKNGILVEEFSIGLGPRLLSMKKGETRYSLKLIPFGGSCQMQGEMDAMFGDAMTEELSDEEKEREKLDPDRSFLAKSVWARISVIFAGPFFNFLLAFVCAAAIISTIGIDRPVIQEVMEGYPAEAAGLQEGDTILSINDNKVVFYRDVLMELQFLDRISPFTIVYERDGEIYETTASFQYSEEDDRYYLGIVGSTSVRTKVNAISVFRYAFSEVRYNIQTTFRSLSMLFSGQAGVSDLTGPVGITSTMGQIMQESAEDGALYVFLNLMNLMVMISANLGVMNLLPLPALDGGRLFFLLIEAVRGKPVPREKEGMIHIVGMLLLMALMAFVFFQDLIRLF